MLQRSPQSGIENINLEIGLIPTDSPSLFKVLGQENTYAFEDPETGRIVAYKEPVAENNDEETEPIPSLEEEAKKGGRGWLVRIGRRAVRGALLWRALKMTPVILPAGILMTASCAHVRKGISRLTGTPSEIAKAEFNEDDYAGGIRQIKRMHESKRTEADKKLLAKLIRMNETKFRTLLEETKKVDGRKGMQNNNVEALQLYELMWECLVDQPKHEYYKRVKIRFADLKKLVAEAQKDYDAANAEIARLRAIAFENKNYTKLANAIHKKQMAGPRLGLDVNQALALLCAEIASDFENAGRKKEAALYFSMAQKINDGLIPGKEHKGNFADSAAKEAEAKREARLERLKKYAEELLVLKKRNVWNRTTNKRAIALSYEIIESGMADEIENEEAVELAEDIKTRHEKNRSAARIRSQKKQRAAARASASAKANEARKKKEEEKEGSGMEGLIADAEANGNGHSEVAEADVLPQAVAEEQSNSDAELIIAEIKECRRLRNLEKQSGIAYCREVLKMNLTTKQRAKVESLLQDLIDIFSE